MKKILFCILFAISTGLFAQELEFTWARYEMLCYQYGKEPSYTEYVYLVEHPMDFDDEEELLKIMAEVE